MVSLSNQEHTAVTEIFPYNFCLVAIRYLPCIALAK